MPPLKRKKNKPGPNPNPEKYVLVKTKEGSFYRLKRGLKKEAPLNESLQQSADGMKVCSPAAKRIAVALEEPLRGLQTGRLLARLSGGLRKAYHQKGRVDFSFLDGYDFQPEHPLEDLLKVPYKCELKNGSAHVEIPIEKQSVKRQNQLVSGYYFDLILLWGDAVREGGLRVEGVTSPLYSLPVKNESECMLSLPLPDEEMPWMALLKISCLEGDELAHHPRHYGMKVVKCSP